MEWYALLTLFFAGDFKSTSPAESVDGWLGEGARVLEDALYNITTQTLTTCDTVQPHTARLSEDVGQHVGQL